MHPWSVRLYGDCISKRNVQNGSLYRMLVAIVLPSRHQVMTARARYEHHPPQTLVARSTSKQKFQDGSARLQRGGPMEPAQGLQSAGRGSGPPSAREYVVG